MIGNFYRDDLDNDKPSDDIKMKKIIKWFEDNIGFDKIKLDDNRPKFLKNVKDK